MRLSKSPAVSLEGDRICYFRKTVAQPCAEQSLTILIGLWAVKASTRKSSRPSGVHGDQVIALLALAQDQVSPVQGLRGRRHRPGRIAYRLAVQLDRALGDQLPGGPLRAGEPAGQQQVDDRNEHAGRAWQHRGRS